MHAQEAAPSEASRLLRHKVELPDPIDGCVRRPEVAERCARPQRRLTAYTPRGLRQDGSARSPLPSAARTRHGGRLDLAIRKGRTGIGVYPWPSSRQGEDAGARIPAPVADNQAEYRINQLIRALERHGAPCVLALDELERLRTRQ